MSAADRYFAACLMVGITIGSFVGYAFGVWLRWVGL